MSSQSFKRAEGGSFLGGGTAELGKVKVAEIHILEFKRIWPYFDSFIIRAGDKFSVGKGDHRPDSTHMTLEIAYILESSHVEHVDCSIV